MRRLSPGRTNSKRRERAERGGGLCCQLDPCHVTMGALMTTYIILGVPYYHFGVPYNAYSILGPKTLFRLLRPVCYTGIRDCATRTCNDNRVIEGVPAWSHARHAKGRFIGRREQYTARSSRPNERRLGTLTSLGSRSAALRCGSETLHYTIRPERSAMLRLQHFTPAL